MARVLHFDAFSGVSGDMTIGAMLDLGLDPARLRAELAALALGGYELRISTREPFGIRATKFDVDVEGRPHGDRAHAAGHAHRPYREIRAMLEASALKPAVKERALAIFTTLAGAEGRIHGVPPDEVEFHEVGAVDSIVDIVGTAIGLVALDVDWVCVSPLPLGSGTVWSQHGHLPVPSPATIELLKGFAVRFGDGEGEMVTPTGAAIVATLARPGEALPPLRVEAVGYGAGTRSLSDRPNVLRLVLGTAAAGVTSEEMIVIEANIDDANPELYEHAMERLFAAGARDVWIAPIQMKKNRPGVLLRVLADPSLRDPLAAIVFRETTAIGLRVQAVQRLSLPRETVTVETEYGSVQVKIARAPDGSLNVAPEYESCRRVAAERAVPLKIVYQAAVAAAHGKVR